jgi:hypothetical protein
MSAECSRIVYSYFSGFVLLALGAMVVIFGLLSTSKVQEEAFEAQAVDGVDLRVEGPSHR